MSTDGEPVPLPTNNHTDQLAGAVQALTAYGDEHSLVGAILRAIPGEPSTPREPVPSAGELKSAHDQTFATIGLSLEVVQRGGHSTLNRGVDQKETSQSEEFRVNITNHGQFVAFLRSLRPEDMQQGGLATSITYITNALARQIDDTYDFTEKSDELLEVVAGLPDITDELKRLGLSAESEKLAEYLFHIRQGTIPEYKVIKYYGLMNPPDAEDGFGPARWQLDTDPEGLEERWQAALDVLTALQRNPKATEYASALGANLVACIERARTFPEHYDDDYKKPLLEVIARVEPKLRRLLETDLRS